MNEPGNKTGDGARNTGESEPLSATAMFFSSFAQANKPGADEVEDIMASPRAAEPLTPPVERDDPFASFISPRAPSTGSSAGHTGDFTQLFQALNSTPSAQTAELYPKEDAGLSFVEKWPSSADRTPDTDDELFSGLDAHAEETPLQQGGADLNHRVDAAETPDFTPEPVVADPKTEQQSAEAIGEFTSIFVSAPAAQPDQVATAVAATPPTPGPASASASSQSPAKKRGFSSPGVSDAASSAGSFSQPFSSSATAPLSQPSTVIALAPSGAVPTETSSVRRPEASEIQPREPSFTQLFSPVKVTPPAAPAPTVHSSPAAPPPAASATPNSIPAAATPEGSFTQFFAKVAPTPTVSAPQPAAIGPTPPVCPAPATTASAAEGSFTQIFSTSPVIPATQMPSPREERPSATPAVDNFNWSRPPATGTPTGGATPSVTQLFRALSSEDSPTDVRDQSPGPYAASTASPVSEAVSFSSSPSSSVANSPFSRRTETQDSRQSQSPQNIGPENFSSAPGGVTQLIRMLTEEVYVTSAPAAAAEPSVAPAPIGPGEFTRIISGEVLRSAVGVPAPQAQPTPSAFPLPSVAVTSPAVAKPSFTPPAMPLAPPPHVTAGPAANLAFAAPATPHASAAAPAVTPPRVEPPRVEVPRPAPTAVPAGVAETPKSKLQQMLPLILVLNAFLLVVLIVVVFFALRSR